MAEILNASCRKGIKTMAKVAWVANVVSQIPQPKDFALMITSDIISLAGKVQSLVTDMNNLMDTYTDIPIDFISGHLNSIFDSTVSALNKANSYANGVVTDTSSVVRGISSYVINGDGTAEDGSLNNLIDANVDLFNDTTDLTIATSQRVSESAKSLTNKNGVTEGLDEAIANVSTKTTEGMKKAQESLNKVDGYISDATNKLNQKLTDATGNITSNIQSYQQKINDLLNNIKNLIKSFSSCVDDAFGVTTIKSSSVAKTTLNLSNIDTSTENDSSGMTETVATLVGESSKTVYSILQNFSIGKFITGCTGIIATSTLMESGIMSLPHIDVEQMIKKVAGKKKVKTTTLPFDDQVQYDDSAYKEYTDTFADELKKQRNEIRKKLANQGKLSSIRDEEQAYNSALITSGSLTGQVSNNLKKQLRKDAMTKSAIANARKYRRKARRAKIANKVKDTLLSRLKQFISEMKTFFNGVKERWNNMLQTYTDSVKQIKSFFTDGGAGDETINHICNDINQNFDDIKKLCTQDLPVQISNVSVNVALPRAVGMCMTNIAQHIVQFFAECKVIIKFIMDLIKYIKNIIADVKQLMNIIFNGINNLASILKQLYDLISFKWLINLIQKVKDLFSQCVENASEEVESTLQAIYYKDTEDYSNRMNAIDALTSGNDNNQSLTSTEILKYANQIGCDSALASAMYNGGNSKYSDDDVDNYIQSLEDSGENIVAYRAIRFKRDEDGKIITYRTDDSQTEEDDTQTSISIYTNGYTCDIPTVEYYSYFHPDLSHREDAEFKWGWFHTSKMIARRKKTKGKFIQRCAQKTGKSGGINMLSNKTNLYKNTKTNKKQDAYSAFYWYRKNVSEDDFYDDEPDLNAEDGTTETSTRAQVSVTSDSGSVVTIDLGDGKKQKLFVKNAVVKNGDYVTYNGKKYKIV